MKGADNTSGINHTNQSWRREASMTVGSSVLQKYLKMPDEIDGGRHSSLVFSSPREKRKEESQILEV